MQGANPCLCKRSEEQMNRRLSDIGVLVPRPATAVKYQANSRDVWLAGDLTCTFLKDVVQW